MSHHNRFHSKYLPLWNTSPHVSFLFFIKPHSHISLLAKYQSQGTYSTCIGLIQFHTQTMHMFHIHTISFTHLLFISQESAKNHSIIYISTMSHNKNSSNTTCFSHLNTKAHTCTSHVHTTWKRNHNTFCTILNLNISIGNSHTSTYKHDTCEIPKPHHIITTSPSHTATHKHNITSQYPTINHIPYPVTLTQQANSSQSQNQHNIVILNTNTQPTSKSKKRIG